MIDIVYGLATFSLVFGFSWLIATDSSRPRLQSRAELPHVLLKERRVDGRGPWKIAEALLFQRERFAAGKIDVAEFEARAAELLLYESRCEDDPQWLASLETFDPYWIPT